MSSEYIEQELRILFGTLPHATLRVLGRKYGVPQASQKNKEELIDGVVAILTGAAEPTPRSNRGAPSKQSYLDPVIIERIERILRDGADSPERGILYVSSGEKTQSFFDQHVYAGILEITASGYGFVRANNCQPTANGGDVFIPASVIHSYKLREGDFITCTAKPSLKNEASAFDTLMSVNGMSPSETEQRPFFDTLTAQYAKEKINLSASGALSMRMLDLFSPIGKGQRALIIAPPKAGKTTLLKDIAHTIETCHDDISLIILLIDERPEEVTDIRSGLRNAELIYSTFDEGAEHHARAAQLTIAHAKRLAEQGKDVVLLLDSLTKLTRAYNYIAESTGKTLTGGLDVSAFAEPKRFFGAARNTVEAGSLTILATVLVETGSRMDDVIYEEFKGTGNSDIFLSRELSERRIFPAIDVRRSGTRKEELLLDKTELSAVNQLRERGLTENVSGIIDMLKQTADNAEFVARLPEWLKIYKNK